VASVGGCVNPRKYGGEKLLLAGCKRRNAALTTMLQRIAPTPRQGCASPGCIRPQPAIDPASGLSFTTPLKHFLCPKKTLRQIYADFDSRSQQDVYHAEWQEVALYIKFQQAGKYFVISFKER